MNRRFFNGPSSVIVNTGQWDFCYSDFWVTLLKRLKWQISEILKNRPMIKMIKAHGDPQYIIDTTVGDAYKQSLGFWDCTPYWNFARWILAALKYDWSQATGYSAPPAWRWTASTTASLLKVPVFAAMEWPILLGVSRVSCLTWYLATKLRFRQVRNCQVWLAMSQWLCCQGTTCLAQQSKSGCNVLQQHLQLLGGSFWFPLSSTLSSLASFKHLVLQWINANGQPIPIAFSP